MQKIEHLEPLGIADWIRSYMHVLRIFGNEAAHERQKLNRKPLSINETDIALSLFCLQRLLEFWVDYREAAASTPAH